MWCDGRVERGDSSWSLRRTGMARPSVGRPHLLRRRGAAAQQQRVRRRRRRRPLKIGHSVLLQENGFMPTPSKTHGYETTCWP